MDRAEEVATSVLPGSTTAGPGIGTQTADAYVDLMTSERVLLSSSTDLDGAGAGVGHIVRISGLTDAEIAQMLRDIDARVLPAKPVFQDMNITVVELTDSVRVLREKGVDIPADHWGTGGLRQTVPPDAPAGTLPVGATGPAAEILIAGKDVRNGGNVSGFGIDLQNPEYADTKIDYLLGDDLMIQVGVTLDTVIAKISKNNADALAMANAIAKAKFLEPDRHFVFKYQDPTGAKPPQNKIEYLNARIANPANWLTPDNFIPVTSIP